MKITPEDPRLTAYALGELDDKELQAVAAELDAAGACRSELDEISRTAGLLEAELAAESMPELTYAQQLAIEKALGPEGERARPERPSGNWFWGLSRGFVGFLATVAVIAVLAAMLLPALSRAKNKSMRSQLMSEYRMAELSRQMRDDAAMAVVSPENKN